MAENSINSSGNQILKVSGDATNNTIIINTNISQNRKSLSNVGIYISTIATSVFNFLNIFLSRNSNVIEEEEEESEIITPKDKNLILTLIWKYLDKDDKFNCTLVCYRFSKLISENYFSLNFNSSEKPRNFIPILTRNYKKITFFQFNFYHLDPRFIKMLKHLSNSLVELSLTNLNTNLMTLRDLLYELPMLERLELFDIKFKETELSLTDLPMFLHLRQLEIWFNDVERIYPIFKSATCIQTLSLRSSLLKQTDLHSFLVHHKSSLS